MDRLPHFYLVAVLLALVPWIAGLLLYGKAGLVAGLAVSFLGIMLWTDANNRHVHEQHRRRMRRG